MLSITRQAPAKVNLGLEVTGRRADGYHDLVTIFQTISLADTVTLSPAPALSLTTNVAAIAGSDNLVLRALRELQRGTRHEDGAKIELTKRIPLASGLGGASSDAAAALIAATELWQLPLTDDELHRIAALVGSDVPFFLRGGTALGTGRGEQLAPLPPLAAGWFVVVSPVLAIPHKTAVLYAALTPGDFTGGSRVRRQAARLRRGDSLDPALLGNAFQRPLHALAPELATVRQQMLAAGSAFVALSGAGPSYYTLLAGAGPAQTLAHELSERLHGIATVALCQADADLGNIPS